MSHPILFVGAGPGDPELITVKGQGALKEADVIIYAGSLVPKRMLKWARPDATLINSASMNLEEIIIQIEKSYNEDKLVVRLHTGDPSLYGAIFEQIATLEKKMIPCKVIPGVTAAFAAAASMGLEYTLPKVSQTLILTRVSGRTPVPQSEELEHLAKHQSSMAIYLSMGLMEKTSKILTNAYGKDAPCVIAYRVSQPDEKIIHTTVGELFHTAKEKNIYRQAIIIVGKVLEVTSDSLIWKSKLYDKDFSHGYRNDKKDER